MKKSLLLLTTLLFSVAGFAQWTKPIPEYGPMVDDGETIQYLYNLEAGAFLIGANDWGTRASISYTQGYKMKFEKIYSEYDDEDNPIEGAEVIGWALRDSVESKSAWNEYDCQGYDNIWCDGTGRSGAQMWQIVSLGDNKYNIYNTNVPAFENPEEFPLFGWAPYQGSETNTRCWILDSYYEDAEEVPYFDPEKLCTTWVFVSPEAYEAYFAKYEVYDAAQTLKAKIDEAKELGLSTAEAEAVYNNTASSIEELKDAAEAVQTAINDYKENAATPENPQDLTDAYIPDADFEQDQGAGVWKRTQSPEAQNFQTGNTAGKQGDNTPFLESWDGSAYTSKIYVAIDGLPNGVYQFNLSAFTNGGYGSYVYAGTDSVEVTTTNMTPYTVFTRVEDGTLEVGLNSPKAIQNWVGIDDAKLFYLGNSAAAYAYWVKYNMDNAPRYTEEDFVQKAALEAYNAVLSTDLSAYTTADEILAFNDTFLEAVATIKENAAAYARYLELLDLVEELQTAGYEGAEADELYDYIMDDPQYSAEKVQEGKALSTEEMLAECEKLAGMIDVVKANCLAEGMECTNLLTNPNFNDRLTGWEYDSSLGTPAWGGLSDNPCVERWNENFNFYQTVANVPNGVYELTVQAFYRPTGSTTGSYNNYVADPEADEILTFIYANQGEAPVKNIAAHSYSENLEGNCEEVATGVFVPNGMTSASNAFSRGDYESSVIGVVTDGTLTVGIKCLNGTESGRWPLWDNFRLFYRGKSAEVLKGVLPDLLDNLAQYIEENQDNMTTPAVNAAQAVQQDAEDALSDEDGDAMMAAITALNQALYDAKANVAAMTAIDAAITALDEAAQEYYEKATPQAQNAYEEIVNKTDDYTDLTTAELETLTQEINAVITALKIPAEEASDENPISYTHLIQNATFDEIGDFTGWSPGFGAGGTTSTNAECYQKNFDVYQDIEGLPAGTYRVACYGYYRQGSAANDYDATVAELADPHYYAYIYAIGENADSCKAPMMNLCAGMLESGLGGTTLTVGPSYVVPNTMEAANYWFEAGYYAPTDDFNSVIVKVGEDGKLRIGVKKDITISADWAIFDNFTLIYYGTNSANIPTDIDAVAPATTTVAAGIYSLSGARLSGFQKGINIVKTGDGQVKKVYVK